LVSDVKTQIDATKSMRKQIDKAIAKQVLQYTKNTNRFFGNTATNYGWE
jgi:hypothetical protein